MDIERSLELSSKATPGPWVQHSLMVSEASAHARASSSGICHCGLGMRHNPYESETNAAFIADARENFPELLKRFKRLRELLGSMSWASGNCELSLAAYLEIQQLLSPNGKDGA